MSYPAEYIRGRTVHVRRGEVVHRFGYSVDYVMIDPEHGCGPLLLSRRGPNLATVRDRDHGGERGHGQGAVWLREVLQERGLPARRIGRILLLTQPGFFGAVFNPVSFWLVYEGEALIAVVAEVNNTFGDRHSYLCAHPGFSPIGPKDRLHAKKVFHVSPFQEIAGEYVFGFDICSDRVAIVIDHRNGEEALVATLAGPRQRLTSAHLLVAALRRPLGAMRTVILIYWQAIRLRIKGAPYRTRPLPPKEEVS